MADYAVKTSFRAQDRVTKAFSSMSRGADKFGKRSSRAFQKASRHGSRFGDIVKGILAAGVISRGVGLLQQGVASVAREFVGFDDAITSSSAKFKDLNLATTAGQKTLLELKKTARDVGAATQFSAGQAASGLDFLAMAGFNTQQAMASLPGVVDLATNAKVDLAMATDIASDSLGAFGMMTKDSVKLQKNLTRINDVMALTMARTNTGIEDMFEAVKKGAPTFTSTGQSVETFNALIGIMANAGVKGAESGTQLRNIMLRLAKPTGAAQKELKSLGIVTKDSRGNFRDVVDILSDFEKGLKGMGTQQRAATLSTVFGARAVTGVNILLHEGAGAMRDFRAELVGSAGASKKMANIMRQSLGNRLKSLSSAAIELGFKFFTAFEKQGGNAIDKITKAIRNFDMNPIIEGTKTAIRVVKGLYSVIKPFLPIMPVLVGGMIAYNLALKAQMALGAIKSFIAFIKVIKGAAAAQGILNVIMTANPIGVIIMAVAALIAGMVILEKKFKIFSVAFKFWKTQAKTVGKFFGFGSGSDTAQKSVVPPNRAEVEARQQVAFQGKLQIAGAPPGSTVKSKTTGAPPIDVELLGANIG